MSQIVRAEEDGWLIRLHVEPDNEVQPGDALYDIVREDDGGLVKTVTSLQFGTVKAYDEISIFPANDGSAPIHLKRGAPMFMIQEHDGGWQAGTIRGLTPRPTRVIAKRRARQLNLI